MAYSQCGNCGNHSFELQEVNVSGANFRHFFIQCASCGVPVTAVEFTNLGQGIEDLDKRISSLEDNLGMINENIGRIATFLRKG